jgi:hypothetical protein
MVDLSAFASLGAWRRGRPFVRRNIQQELPLRERGVIRPRYRAGRATRWTHTSRRAEGALDMHQEATQPRAQVRRRGCQQLQQRVLEAASVCMAWELMKVLLVLPRTRWPAHASIIIRRSMSMWRHNPWSALPRRCANYRCWPLCMPCKRCMPRIHAATRPRRRSSAAGSLRDQPHS